MRRKYYIGALVVVGLVLSWYSILHRPARVRINSLRKSLKAEQQRLADYQKEILMFVSAKDDYTRIQKDSLEYAVAMNATDKVIALYEWLDSICHQRGYQLEEIAPSLEEVIRYLRTAHDGRPSATVPIRIRIRGRYIRLAKLIETIENSRYFEGIVTSRISGSEQVYPDCLLQLAFTARLDGQLEVAARE